MFWSFDMIMISNNLITDIDAFQSVMMVIDNHLAKNCALLLRI